MRAVVTGAGVRVGRATALELARSGFDVAVHYSSSADAAEEVARACGEGSFTVKADLATPEGCRALVDAVSARWDTLDLLVNNASVFEPCAFDAITLEAWERMLAINLRAPFLVSQGLLPLLRASGSALVVHLCDIGADDPIRGYTHYSVSKAGLVMLVKSMGIELAPAVRTVGISPGQVAWPEDYDDERRERLRRRIPMGRAGEPEDVARLIRFLALEATYVNAANLPVDGGLSARY